MGFLDCTVHERAASGRVSRTVRVRTSHERLSTRRKFGVMCQRDYSTVPETPRLDLGRQQDTSRTGSASHNARWAGKKILSST